MWYLILGAVGISTLCVHLWGLEAVLLAVLGQAGVGGTAALGHHIVFREVNGEVGAGWGRPRRACQGYCPPPQGLWTEGRRTWATANQVGDQRPVDPQLLPKQAETVKTLS